MWTARRAGRMPAGPMVSHEARRAEITLLATLLVTPGVPANKVTNNVTNYGCLEALLGTLLVV